MRSESVAAIEARAGCWNANSYSLFLLIANNYDMISNVIQKNKLEGEFILLCVSVATIEHGAGPK